MLVVAEVGGVVIWGWGWGWQQGVRDRMLSLGRECRCSNHRSSVDAA